MLHWFAGQKQADGSTDPDATGYVEPPETPAPVFAVRAFKHVLFGTPQTAQPNTRRHSNAENARAKHVEQRPSRPGLIRPKSASDAPTLAKPDVQLLEEPLSSPTKGILLSPGTVAARKKNVTFGEHVIDNEEKRPLKSGLPDDCPGKFPSPWNKDSDDSKKRDESPEKGRGRSKLTEALEQVRDESRKRKPKSDKREKHADDEEGVPAEHAEPRSDSGKYWKREYDVYRTNTQREVKKLITKQQAAKSFAQTKDAQCTELADQLRQEQKKVEMLEAKTIELASLMKDCQDELRASQDAEKKHQEEIAVLKRQLGRRDTVRPGSSHSATASTVKRSELEMQVDHERAKLLQQPLEQYKPRAVQEDAEDDPVQRPSEPYNASALSEKTKSDARTLGARSKSKPDNLSVKSNDDIWAQSLRSSSPSLSQSVDKPLASNKSARTVTSGTDATPLKTLNVNTLQNGPDSKRVGSLQSMDVECQSIPDVEMLDSKRSSAEDVERYDSALFPSALPLPSPEPQSASKLDQIYPSTQHREVDVPRDDAASRLPVSSPFESEIKTKPLKTAPAGPRAAPESKTTLLNNTKENIAPIPKSTSLQQESNVKPSALWSSINAPQAGKRSTSITGKDGREVSLDRIEAARARIAARGRVTS